MMVEESDEIDMEQMWKRFNNCCQELASLNKKSEREKKGKLNMPPQKKKNRETRAQDLTERIIPQLRQKLSGYVPFPSKNFE